MQTPLWHEMRTVWSIFFFMGITFVAHAQYELVGSATQLTDNCFQITPDQTFQTGSVWAEEQVDISKSFDIYFQISLGCKDVNGADGLAFVLQQVSNNIGGFGLDLGYGGLFPSIAVEFDVFENSNRADPAYDHVAIMSNGRAEHNTSHNRAGPVPILAAGTNAEDCNAHQVRIHWDALQQTLEVFVDCRLRLSYTHDLIANIFKGNPKVFWGFTGSTGGLSNIQGFCLEYASFVNDLQDTTICKGDSVDFALSGGISYQWEPSTGLSNTTIPNPTAFPDTTTTYIATISFPCGNQWYDTLTVFVEEAIANAGVDREMCLGDSLQLAGFGNGTYNWSSSSTIDNPTIAGPWVSPSTSSSFTLSVTNPLGCMASDEVHIQVNPLPQIAVEGDSVMCLGDSVLLRASGANSYIWGPRVSISAPLGDSIFVFPRDTMTYILVGEDGNGCKDTIDFPIYPLSPPIAQISPDTSICLGDSVQLFASGGVSYSWSPDTSLSQVLIQDPFASPTRLTEYSVEVSDDFGCKDTQTVQVNVLPLPDAQAGLDVRYCVGDSTQFQASGGVSYEWFPRTGLSDYSVPTPYVFTEDTIVYLLVVTGSNGCTDEDRTTAYPLPSPQIFAGEDTFICEGDILQLTASGGVNYQWSPSDYLNDPTIADPISTTPAYIVYSVESVGSNGCIGSDEIEIRIRARPLVDAGDNMQICQGEMAVLEGSGAQEYLWSPSTYIPNPSLAAISVNPTESITYSLFGTDSYGCSNEDTVRISVFQAPFLTGPTSYEICRGEEILLTTSSAPAYKWNTGDTTSFISVSPSQSLNYWVVPFNQNCAGDTLFISVAVDPTPPKASFQVSSQTGFYPLEIDFINTSQNAAAHRWEFGDGNYSLESQARHTYERPGDFQPKLTVLNDWGCADSIQGEIIKVWAPSLFIPSAFSPNGDGHNDRFFFGTQLFQEMRVTIFDRWGRVIFQTRDKDFYWDGSVDGKPAAEGVYSYMVIGKDFENRPLQRQGTIHLVR